MASAHDVAAYILREQGGMSAMKLQKLAYYCQAWSLVWDDRPLFSDPIEAWANGPVVRALYEVHRGRFALDPPWPRGNPDALTPAERETVDAVLQTYAGFSSADLAEITHREQPWREARGSTPPGEPSEAAISLATMAEYYGALYGDECRQGRGGAGAAQAQARSRVALPDFLSEFRPPRRLRGVGDVSREKDLQALDALLELAEGSMPNVPQADRKTWVEACLRVRRLKLELAAQEPEQPDDRRSRC